MRNIGVGCQRYYSEHDHQWPEGIDDVYNSIWYPGGILNPYTGKPMIAVNFGDPDVFGNFSYVTEAENGVIVNFYVIGYAPEGMEGLDINGDGVDDHVMNIITNGTWTYRQHPEDFEHLKNLLNDRTSDAEPGV